MAVNTGEKDGKICSFEELPHSLNYICAQVVDY